MTPPLASEAHARELDARDPLAPFRERFHIPPGPDGAPCVYLCGNSLGLQPRGARALVEQELDDWARLGVEAHFHGRTPWYSYHEVLRDASARLVGALPEEVVVMNGLTANLHLMMVSFYRPAGRRRKILVEWPIFPSDLYAARSQIALHGGDPEADLLVVRPEPGRHTLDEARVEALLDARGEEVALVLLAGVNFVTGQCLDMPRLVRAARRHGCAVGFDLAHAAGNVPLRLHDWAPDFAVWCGYKYLNGGPGAVAGCFVHQRHARDTGLLRLAGWWGNDPDTRFRMHLNERFVPRPTADGWQLSNPPILAMAPLRASLALFDEAGVAALREKSLALTGHLASLLGETLPAGAGVEILTPEAPEARGCQLSLRIPGGAERCFRALQAAGVVCDLRPPDVIRVAPVPLYNSFHDVWRFAEAMRAALGTPAREGGLP